MQLHNLMEDIVFEKVNDIFDEEQSSQNRGFCTCRQCRMDVTCYVLNRIQPQYMLSSRGLAHLRNNYQSDMQKAADLMGLINEGIKKVSHRRRPHVSHDHETETSTPKGPLFNFPTIVGRVFNGKNFEPLKDVAIYLYSEGGPVPMINENWLNPYPIADQTAGNYTFWPYPVGAKSVGEARSFEFELFLEAPEFDEFHHFFEMKLTAENRFNDLFHLQQSYKMEDLYVFPL